VLEHGPENVKRFLVEFRSAFHDFHVTIEDQIAEADKVVTCWRIRGIHQGEFRGIDPTGSQSIEQELRMAREIQQALLPKALPRLEGW
jgi:predicted ester cyclase